MSQHWDYLTAKDNQRQVIVWTVAAVTLPAAGAFLWWLSEKGYNNLAPYRVSLAHQPTPTKQFTPLVAKCELPVASGQQHMVCSSVSIQTRIHFGLHCTGIGRTC